MLAKPKHLIACLSLLVMLSACSDLVPGLNVHTGEAGEHQYKVVEDQDNGYTVAKQGSLPAYQVVNVGPQELKAIASEQQEGFDYSLPSILPSDVPPEYRVGPGDVLYVTVWDHPELSTPSGPITDIASLSAQGVTTTQYVQGRLVAADGTIHFPYVGDFKAEGMTTADLRNRLISGLSVVITNPQVDVRIIGFRSARIEVTGEVLKPGTINLDDTPKGIIQAINLCGGLSITASRRRAILVRQGHTYLVDLAGLLSGDRPVTNPLLMAGDVLHIPDQSDDQIFVLGAVDKQQPIPLQQASFSLIQALTTAGGLDFARGKQTGVIVFRLRHDSEQIETHVYTVDLSRPEGILLAGKFDLRPRDVVFVESTAFSQYNSIITQLLPTVSTIFELNQLIK